MRKEIEALIRQIEQEKGVIILFAAESGSRAWGFASPDSDYDVRFIYKRKDHRDYLRLTQPSDVLDRENGLGHICTEVMDFSGWDIFKAMGLFRNSNPAIMEWLDSPVVYMDRGFRHANGRTFAEELRTLRSHVSLRKQMFHYVNLAKGNFFRYIKQKDSVTYKKYLYVLRSIFCCLWIHQDHSVPPTNFQTVMDTVEAPDFIMEELKRIISVKQQLDEADKQPGNLKLDAWIDAQIMMIEGWAHSESKDQLMDEDLLLPILWRELGING